MDVLFSVRVHREMESVADADVEADMFTVTDSTAFSVKVCSMEGVMAGDSVGVGRRVNVGGGVTVPASVNVPV